MKKLGLALLFTVLALTLVAQSTFAQATLKVIGTANYKNSYYKLIYMEGGPFGPITFLDYTRKYKGLEKGKRGI